MSFAFLEFGMDCIPEHRFHPTRRWRFDYAFPDQLLAVEVDGGCFVAGRHSRGASQIADHEKLNAAALLGWRVLHVTPRQVRTGYADRLVRAVLDGDRSFSEVPPEIDSRRKRAKAALGRCKAPSCHETTEAIPQPTPGAQKALGAVVKRMSHKCNCLDAKLQRGGD